MVTMLPSAVVEESILLSSTSVTSGLLFDYCPPFISTLQIGYRSVLHCTPVCTVTMSNQIHCEEIHEPCTEAFAGDTTAVRDAVMKTHGWILQRMAKLACHLQQWNLELPLWYGLVHFLHSPAFQNVTKPCKLQLATGYYTRMCQHPQHIMWPMLLWISMFMQEEQIPCPNNPNCVIQLWCNTHARAKGVGAVAKAAVMAFG